MSGHSLRTWIALGMVVVATGVSGVAVARQAQFVPGHFYTPLDGGQVVEWDGSLNEVRRFSVPGVQTATGATFSGDGYLTFIGNRGGAKVIQIDADGNIIRESADIQGGVLHRGTFLDYDASSLRFLVADVEQVTLFNDELEPLFSTPEMFDRSSGVAFNNEGGFHVVDQFTKLLSTFDSEGQLQDQTTVSGRHNTGMDVAADGDVYYTSFSDGVVYKFDPDTGQTVLAKDGFGHSRVTDLQILPDGRFLVSAQVGPSFLFDQEWNLIAQSEFFGGVGDSTTYFVPSPGAALLLPVSLVVLRSRNKNRNLFSPSDKCPSAPPGRYRVPTRPMPPFASNTRC